MTINYGYEGEQYRGYIRRVGRALFVWQVIGNSGAVDGGTEATLDGAIDKCNCAAGMCRIDGEILA